MADTWTPVRYSEVLPINSGTFTPLTGTETIASVTVTLRDASGAVAGTPPVSAIPIDQGVNGGFLTGPQSAPYAWFDWSAVGLSLPVPASRDTYTLEFLATDSASPVGKYESVVGLLLLRDGT